MIEINLLPKEYRKRARIFQFDKKTICVAAAAGTIVLLLTVVTFYQRHQLSTLDHNIAQTNAERIRLEEDIRLIDNLTGLKEKIIQRMEAIEKLDRYRAAWVDALQDLNNRVPEFMWLTRVAGFWETQKAQAAKKKNIPGQTAADSTQTQREQFMLDKPIPTEIEGYAFTMNSVASLLVGLTKSDYFSDISLSFAKEEQVMMVNAYKFKILCNLSFKRPMQDSEPVEDTWGPTVAER